MQNLKLIIGNKKYSSWSMRPWIAMKVKDIEFEEELSQFDIANNSVHFWEFSPTKKVPVLKHNDQTIWDSLSILEYIAEIYPEKDLWPRDQIQRAHARSISNEIHSGFLDLKAECPMNMNRDPSKLKISDQAKVDVNRIEKIWKDCLDKYNGPFLFGKFTIADAMFAPVVNRIKAYKISENPKTLKYCKTIENLDAWKQWDRAGKAEEWICEQVEL